MPSFILKSEHPKNLNGIRNSIREHDIFLIEIRPFPAFLSVIEDAKKKPLRHTFFQMPRRKRRDETDV
jgi:hypothetical protein